MRLNVFYLNMTILTQSHSLRAISRTTERPMQRKSNYFDLKRIRRIHIRHLLCIKYLVCMDVSMTHSSVTLYIIIVT